jgi:hypothetical protein
VVFAQGIRDCELSGLSGIGDINASVRNCELLAVLAAPSPCRRGVVALDGATVEGVELIATFLVRERYMPPCQSSSIVAHTPSPHSCKLLEDSLARVCDRPYQKGPAVFNGSATLAVQEWATDTEECNQLIN